MKFLADESCAWPVILALRQAGHDVIAIAGIAKGAKDEAVLARAASEQRVLITEDLDFGRLYLRARVGQPVWFCLDFPAGPEAQSPCQWWKLYQSSVRACKARSSSSSRAACASAACLSFAC